jgi:hypothetical protein
MRNLVRIGSLFFEFYMFVYVWLTAGCYHLSKAIKIRKKRKQDKYERRRNKGRFSPPSEADNGALVLCVAQGWASSLLLGLLWCTAHSFKLADCCWDALNVEDATEAWFQSQIANYSEVTWVHIRSVSTGFVVVAAVAGIITSTDASRAV